MSNKNCICMVCNEEKQKKDGAGETMQHAYTHARLIRLTREEFCAEMVMQMTKDVALSVDEKKKIIGLCINCDCFTKEEISRFIVSYLITSHNT